MDSDYIRLREIKPELSGYLNDALGLLKQSPVPSDNAVHDMRVLLKKARAALKLIRTQVPSGYADMDIQSLKEAAGLMSSWRDTSVLRKTLKELRHDFRDVFFALEGNGKIDSIIRKPAKEVEPGKETAAGVASIESLLNKSGRRIRFHQMENLDAQLLLKELETTYLKTMDAFLKCRNKPGPARLHNFRKKAKEFLYQLYFFRPLNSEVIKGIEKKLEIMTRNLGKINDLSQLVLALDYKYPCADNPAMDELVLRIRERQDSYLEKVWPAASKIFVPGRKLVNVLGYKILVI